MNPSPLHQGGIFFGNQGTKFQGKYLLEITLLFYNIQSESQGRFPEQVICVLWKEVRTVCNDAI